MMFGWPWFDMYPDPQPRRRNERPAWHWPVKTNRSGTLDELIDIKAVAGAVELGFGAADEAGGVRLTISAAGIDQLVKRLEAARDAAALMASAKVHSKG